MKAIIEWFLRWWLRSGRYGWSKMRRCICERKYAKQPLPKIKSLEDVKECLKQVKWKQEGLLHLYDSISYPQTAWAKKEDDCDGFAVLAAELLYRLNPDYRPVIITSIVMPITRSHTVCAFNSLQGNMWFFDNAKLKRDGYISYAEIAAKIGHRGDRKIC